MEVKSRDEIEAKYHWDLASIYATDEAFLQALEQAKQYPAQCAAYQGKVSQSPQELLSFLRLDDEASVALSRLVNYAQRKSDEDTRISKYQDFSSQAMSLYVAVSSACLLYTSSLKQAAQAVPEAQAAWEEAQARAEDPVFAGEASAARSRAQEADRRIEDLARRQRQAGRFAWLFPAVAAVLALAGFGWGRCV